MELTGQLPARTALPPENESGTHWIGGWVGPGAVWTLWRKENSLALTGNRTPILRPSSS
jgi:hypothetical protein